MESLNATDIIVLIITGISVFDFIVFTLLFTIYLLAIQYKTYKWSTRLSSIIIMLFFLIFKLLHIPAFLSTVSIFNINIKYYDWCLFILTWVNITLTGFPMITSLYTLIYNLFEKKEDVEIYKNSNIIIVMPIYNETPESLWKGIESVKKSEYNLDKIHLYLAFDDDNEPDAFKYIMQKWNRNYIQNDKVINIHDTIKISVCRFTHGGKKSAQKGAYELIKNDYNESDNLLKESLLLFIDSDIQLKEDALWQFVKHINKYNKTCITGMITCITSDNPSFLAFYQDMEYVSGQIFWRNFENITGTTSCLPGAFTIMKWTSFDNISTEYFNKTKYDDSFDYQRFYLGEDRYMTHLLMEKEPWKQGFCEAARCKTEAPSDLLGLLKQRRRWFLGHISNDTWMISSLYLWKTYPVFTLFNFLNNSRYTSVYIYLLYFVLLLNNNVTFISWFLFLILPIICNWVFIMYYSFKLKRKMNAIFYILIVLLQPIFNMLYMYYTIYTIKQHTWGGIRVDRAKSIEYTLTNNSENNSENNYENNYENNSENTNKMYNQSNQYKYIKTNLDEDTSINEVVEIVIHSPKV